MTDVLIVSTAHWSGDPRLRRHVQYLQAADIAARIESFATFHRVAALFASLLLIARADADTILLPDPELYFLGGLAARLSGKRAVIDIHEDYPKAAAARSWIPSGLRPVIALVANVAVRLGRWVAHGVVVAAPELRSAGDIQVLNIPDPGDMKPGPGASEKTLVYVGDITIERGAAEMVDLMDHLEEEFHLLLIGRVSPEAATALAGRLGHDGRITLAGRLRHEEAWSRASQCIAGLSLLRNVPAYQTAVATKLWEYMAVGLPPIVSDLPGQRGVVSKIDEKLICRSPSEAAEAARWIAESDAVQERLRKAGRDLVSAEWEAHRPDLAIQRALAP